MLAPSPLPHLPSAQAEGKAPKRFATHLRVLMALAKEVGDAKRSGDPVALEKALREHEAFRQECLAGTESATGLPFGALTLRT